MEANLSVFVSSAITEFKEERRVVKNALDQFPLTKSWIFEYSPASTDKLEQSYLQKVQECDLFVLLLGKQFREPVKKEWEIALSANKPRLVFIKQCEHEVEVQSLITLMDVKWDEFDSIYNLILRVKEAVADELIRVYRRYRSDEHERDKLLEFKSQSEEHTKKDKSSHHVININQNQSGEIQFGNSPVEVKEDNGLGLKLNRFVAKLDLEQKACADVRELKGFERQKKRKQMQHDLGLQRDQFLIDREIKKTEHYSSLMKGGQWQLLALRLAQNPEDVGTVLQMMQQQEHEQRRHNLDVSKVMIESDAIEDFQIKESAKRVLENLVKAVDPEKTSKK